jgi:hypothetical protein
MIELATILVSEVEARVVDLKPIPAKIAGGTVRMIYDDPMWERLTKNAVFVGSKAVTVLDIGDVVEIPAEAVAHPGKMLKIGICGTTEDGKSMIPTIYANLGQVRPAADPDADTSTDPGLPVWAQLQAEIEQLKQGGVVGGGSLVVDEEGNLTTTAGGFEVSDDGYILM